MSRSKARIAWVVAVVTIGAVAVGAVANAQDERTPLPDGARIDRIVVYKGDRRMETYDGETLVRSYRVAVGTGGTGPKRFEGDARTPEGTYRIDSRHRSRQFHRFLHVSYPNADDRRRYRDLRRRGEVPEGRGIGSAIGIHGEPTGFQGLGINALDWTAGCIAVDNDEIEELYRAVADDAVIVIHP